MDSFSYSLCARQESDLRPSGPQPDALSTELRAHAVCYPLIRQLAERAHRGTLKYAAISRDCQRDQVHACLREHTEGE